MFHFPGCMFLFVGPFFILFLFYSYVFMFDVYSSLSMFFYFYFCDGVSGETLLVAFSHCFFSCALLYMFSSSSKTSWICCRAPQREIGRGDGGSDAHEKRLSMTCLDMHTVASTSLTQKSHCASPFHISAWCMYRLRHLVTPRACSIVKLGHLWAAVGLHHLHPLYLSASSSRMRANKFSLTALALKISGNLWM